LIPDSGIVAFCKQFYFDDRWGRIRRPQVCISLMKFTGQEVPGLVDFQIVCLGIDQLSC
jgi:hypothetical protein